MPAHLTASITLAALRKPIGDIYSASKDAVKRKLKNINTDAQIKEIYKAISSVQKVKTMWRIDKEVPLQTFYYPSKVIVSNVAKGISNIAEISATMNFVIQGTVGQGKSIFLRYLCIKELAAAERVPIFLELRRYNPKDSFTNFLINAIATYQIPCDKDVFHYLAESGKLVLLLDAFDEVEPESVGHVVNEVESLAQQYPRLQIIVTSRPDSGIQNSPHFRVFQLAPLTQSDHKPFLEKIVDEVKKVKEILEAIAKSRGRISTLLQTPLLMSLLVIIYNATQEIPTSLPQFYDALFDTLLTRHDKTKPGFSRKRKSQLSDSELKRVFEAFCYAARQQDQLVLTVSSSEQLLLRACQVTGIQCKPEAFITDITKLACVMQQEGFEYHFIHKSVVEFHAACFISHTSEENAQKFYAGILSSKWHKWRQELEFLSEIDRHRYLKYFYVPSSLDAMKSLDVDLETTAHLSQQAAMRLLNGILLVPSPSDPTQAEAPVHFQFNNSGGYVANSIQMAMFHKVISHFRQRILNVRGLHGPTGLTLWLEQQKGLDHGVGAAQAAVADAHRELQKAHADMALEARIGSFVDP